MRFPFLPFLVFVAAFAWLSGCSKSAAPASSVSTDAPKPALPKIRFQTDWLPQTEHGGFYQALAKNYYREAGVDVDILRGGPGPLVQQKLIGGVADMAMLTSDALIVNVSNGLPLVIVGVFMQHDPQAILLHEESPVKSFADLDGKAIMAIPGSNWLEYIKAHHHIDFKLIPLNFSLAQFMADREFIQQCFITNEPYYVRKNGAKARALLIADSGYDPYRTLVTTQKFLREHPDAVRAFVAATVRGWADFMTGDPTPARKLIAERNDQMQPEFMDYSFNAIKEYHLVDGRPGTGETTGLLTRRRLQAQVDLLVQLKIIPAPIPLEKFVSFDFLPPELRAKVD
jgi:NitT/TauT family transport system substrate-binding protein